ncbi:MAG: DNA-protecting protein DprA [Betaproteobacteria bacterium]|nr:DNA-protecting protein DprA [Betaproteobacteria bacterium]
MAFSSPSHAHWPWALRLLLTPGLGLQSARRLWRVFGSLPAIWAQPVNTLAQEVGEPLAMALQTEPPLWAAHCARTQAWLEATDAAIAHAVWTWDDAAFPAGLLALPDAPLLLFARGQLHRPLGPALAVVGSRNPTHQGRENARAFAYSLTAGGYAVVSGLAMGIDAAAHTGAMQADTGSHCPTVAVVGTGLDLVYPRQHLGLAHDIAACGWVLSELPLGTQALPHHFPQRNRLIAGLSLGVLVVEAALQSGSLITAQLALDQGKEVFAIPGSIHSALSRGCHALLRQGAKLVENLQDISEELPTLADFSPASLEPCVPAVLQQPHARELWQALEDEAQGLDELVMRCGLPVPQVLALLQMMQDQACVAITPSGHYQRIRQLLYK